MFGRYASAEPDAEADPEAAAQADPEAEELLELFARDAGAEPDPEADAKAEEFYDFFARDADADADPEADAEEEELYYLLGRDADPDADPDAEAEAEADAEAEAEELYELIERDADADPDAEADLSGSSSSNGKQLNWSPGKPPGSHTTSPTKQSQRFSDFRDDPLSPNRFVMSPSTTSRMLDTAKSMRKESIGRSDSSHMNLNPHEAPTYNEGPIGPKSGQRSAKKKLW